MSQVRMSVVLLSEDGVNTEKRAETAVVQPAPHPPGPYPGRR